jgi:hypothetical protein
MDDLSRRGYVTNSRYGLAGTGEAGMSGAERVGWFRGEPGAAIGGLRGAERGLSVCADAAARGDFFPERGGAFPGGLIRGEGSEGARADLAMSRARRFPRRREARRMAFFRPVFPSANEPGIPPAFGGDPGADAVAAAGLRRAGGEGRAMSECRKPDGERCVQRRVAKGGAERGLSVREDAAGGDFFPRTERASAQGGRSRGADGAWPGSAWRKRGIAARDFLRDSKH